MSRQPSSVQPQSVRGEEIALAVASDVTLGGFLHVPPNACGLVVFVHGSGSSRFSPRNQFVAGELFDRGLATLLMDLLTPSEERVDEVTRHLRFDIDLLARRVVGALDCLPDALPMGTLRLGLFGASTGAAAALIAAAERPDIVRAVVSRGGRPDLAISSLRNVRAPTLFIVGQRDHQVLELNRFALEQITVEKSLAIVPGATHLFEEPGTLEQAAGLAAQWFETHLARAAKSRVS